MNTVQLIGNLSTDVYERQAGEQNTASFKLAVNRPGKDKGADFIWVKTWNGSAAACAKYLAKGSRVSVEGSIRTNRKELSESEYKEYFEVNARSVTFLDPKRDGEAPEAVTASTDEPDHIPSDDDIPF